MRNIEEIEDYIGVCSKYLEYSTCNKDFIKGQIEALEWVLSKQEEGV